MKTIDIRYAGLLAILVLTFFAGKLYAHEGHKKPTPTPQPSSTPSSITAGETTVSETKTEATPEPPEITEFPNYHPLVVHFPVVLLLAAALFQIISFFGYRKEFSVATLILLLTGTISVWLASNVFHAHAGDLPERVNEIFEQHELMAQYTFWLAVAGLIAKAISHFFLKRKWWSEAIVFILLLGASITVSIAGHHGAQLVHMEGVGPQGKYLESHEHPSN